jgi:high-affinity iron transporter
METLSLRKTTPTLFSRYCCFNFPLNPIIRICRVQVFIYLLAIIALLSGAPAAFAAQEQAQRLVSLLDYLGSDYKNAVKNGKILNADEYTEMQEFSKRSQELFSELKEADKTDKAGVEATIKSLAVQIDQKGDPKSVAELAKSAKDKLIVAYNIIPYPKQLPTLQSGKTVYLENCAQCHGESGKGDGPSRATMNPKKPVPANFTDSERIASLSPFKVFNTTTFGIEGTAMASFAALSEEQRWQVAFYVFALRFSADSAKTGAGLLQSRMVPQDITTVPVLATSSDDQLLEKLKTHAAQESTNVLVSAPNTTLGPFSSLWTEAELIEALAYLRRGILENDSGAPLIIIARTSLREAAELYARGEKEKAYQKAVDAYIDGYELVEPALFAKDASFGRALEGLFTQYRNAIKLGVSIEEVQKRLLEIESKLDQASEMLTRNDEYSGIYFFINSALIILREGLEATLVLAAILTILKVMGATHAVRYIHMGWILALIAGGLTWVATQTFLTLSGQHRESMEGFISVFAAVALFYVGYWLHTKSEAKKWQSFIHAKVQNVIDSKKILGLVGISFFAVYREAFEVVLFYQALWLQSANDHHLILWGFVAGLAVLVVLTFGILKVGLKVPLKYFFGVTGTFLYFMAFIFAGTGIKELQVSGWVSTTPVGFPPQIPLLGIYPTLESLAAQALMLGAFFATFLWVGRAEKAEKKVTA